MKVFTISEVEESFFELVEIAENGEPLMIMNNENRGVVLMSYKEYVRLKAETDEKEKDG